MVFLTNVFSAQTLLLMVFRETVTKAYQGRCSCLVKNLPSLGKAVLVCQGTKSWGGPSLPFCSSFWARSSQGLWCQYQLSELQAIVLWMLFFNCQSQVSWVEDEDTDNSVSSRHLWSHLQLGDRCHARIEYEVLRILTRRLKQVKIFSGPVIFLWYSLCLTLGLQDILADQLSREISNNHKELLKYFVFQMSCKTQVCGMP